MKKLIFISGLSTLFIFISFLVFQIAVLIIPQREAPAPIINPGQTPLMVAVTGTKAVAGTDVPSTEFTIYEDAQTTNRTVGEFTVDLNSFNTTYTAADTITIRVYEQIDGTNYRQLDNAIFTVGSITNHGIVKNFMSPGRKVKFTAQTSINRSLAFNLQYAFSFRTEQ